MRIILGRSAIFLGIAGVALLSVGAIATWRTAYAVVDRTKHVTERASDRLGKVEARLVRLEERVLNVTVDVEKIRAAAAALVQRTVKDALAQTEFEQLLDRLDHLLEQAETHGETLSIVSQLFEDTADLRTQLGQNEEQVARFRTIAETLEEAAATLKNTRGALAALRERQRDPDPRKLTDLVERARAPLENLVEGIDRIRQYSVEAREGLDHLHQVVRSWTIGASIILTVVMIWLGLGQVCLVGWGRSRLRPPAPSTSQCRSG